MAGSPCLPGARWPREPGQESTEPSLLFKRLVHWSSGNAELSLGCLFPGKLGTMGESGRSAHSKVAFRRDRTDYGVLKSLTLNDLIYK